MSTIIADTQYATFPECPGFGFTVEPRYMTKAIEGEGGQEILKRRWDRPLSFFTAVPTGNRDADVIQTLLNFWHAVGGTSNRFRFKDWTDYKSCKTTQTPTMLDQPFAILDGGQYLLIKQYIAGTLTQNREIYRPVGSTIVVANTLGAAQTDWTLDESTGILTPGGGFVGTPGSWGGEFDLPCRFLTEYSLSVIDGVDIQSGSFTLRECKPNHLDLSGGGGGSPSQIITLPQGLPPIMLTSAPPAAAAAGYTLQTFGPLPTLGVNLFNWNFFGNVEPGGANVQNGDGSLTCTGNSGNTSNLDLGSAYHSTVGSPPHSWKGLAFGGGGYFEAVIKHPTASGSVSGLGWPSFWMMPIEHWVFGSGAQLDQWPGQAAGFEHFPELDIMEYLNGAVNKFNMAVHDHYSIFPPLLDVAINIGAHTTPADLSQYQKYGLLWILATNTTQGRFEWYFNDVLIGTYSYNKYNTGDAPPPVAHTTAAAIADVQHFVLHFGTHNTALPMTIRSVAVWQASSAGNLSQ